MALRGLTSFLSLEKVWIILPPGEMEIFCLEVMADIPKDKYWFKPNDIYLWTWPRTLTEPMLLFSGLPQKLMITGSDYSLPQPYQSAFPCQLLLPWNHTARRVIKALDVLSVSHISSIETSSCYGYLSYQQLWQPVQSNLSLINESFPIWPLMVKLPTVALVIFLYLLFNVEICVDLI